MNLLKMVGHWGPIDAFLYNHVVSAGLGPLYRRFIAEAILSPRAGAAILDVGCGDGQIAELIAQAHPQCQVTGVDLAPAMIARAKRQRQPLGNLQYRVADAMALPFAAQSFDFVLSVASIKHWPDQRQGLAECWRVLNNGGRVGVLEANQHCTLQESQRFVSYWRRVLPGSRTLVAWYFRRFVAGQGLDLSRLSALARDAGWQDLDAQVVAELPFVVAQAQRRAEP